MNIPGYYDNVSSSYEKQRVTMGSDAMIAMIQFYCGRSLKDIHVLDAGCGTGSHAAEFLEYGVGQITLLDASDGMLGIAKAKLSNHIASGRITEVVKATLPTIPFPNKTFDAVLFNLVLHHLEPASEDRRFRNIVATLDEAKRVLKPDGVIIIGTMLPETMKHSVWFTQILTGLTERYVKIYPYIEEWEHLFKITGIHCLQKMNILGHNLMTNYYNYEGPLDAEWRKACTYWTHATEKELQEVKGFIKELKDKGELENWIKSHDQLKTTGNMTMFVLKQEK